MKTLLCAGISLFFLNSCLYEAPFVETAGIRTDEALLGRWEEVPEDKSDEANRMLVLQHGPNEYVVQYPVGEDAMFFRAFAVELAGGKYFQVQLIGNAAATVKAEDRKYCLLKAGVEGDVMEMRPIDPDLLGKGLADSAAMRAAFAAHKDDPKLWGKPAKFRRIC